MLTNAIRKLTTARKPARQPRNARRHMAEMSDHILRDIGLFDPWPRA